MSQTAAPAKGFALRDLAFIGLFAVLIAVCSWITIPGAVPFTLQTFGVFCTLGMLGGRRGTCAILVYILLGIVGIPVFSGFTGGIGTLSGSLIGILIMGVMSNGMNLLQVNYYWQLVVKGIIILVAVYVDQVKRSKTK